MPLCAYNRRHLIPFYAELVKRNCWSFHENQDPRGKSLIFFSYTSLEITKKSLTKISKSQKITYGKHQKSQITEKLLKNHTKKSLKITRIITKSQNKSCDFKITKITYAILRNDLPLAKTPLTAFHLHYSCKSVALLPRIVSINQTASMECKILVHQTAKLSMNSVHQ